MRSAALLIFLFAFTDVLCQVDSLLVFNPKTPFGPLDLRIARSPENYYYLNEGRTFSFREVNGARTGTYLDMTAWDSEPYEQGSVREAINDSNRFVMNYRLLKPENYDAGFEGGYPLMLVLHGLHERGNCAASDCYHGTPVYSPNANSPAAPTDPASPLLNNDYNLAHGGTNYLEAHQVSNGTLPGDPSLPGRAYPGFVVFPQNLNGWDEAAAENAIRLVRLLIKKYNIDVNKVYINGVSNGGHGAFEAMKRAPWLFAAGILFSAVDDASINEQGIQSRIAGIPLWIFQGGQDTKPTVQTTESYIDGFRKAGANVRYTLYSNLGHGTWNKGFSEPDFFSWLLRQNKNNLHVFSGNPVICGSTGSGAKLSLPAGYKHYEWELNGEVIRGATTDQYIANDAGSYRGRFWNVQGETPAWSDPVAVTRNDPDPVKLSQIGSIILRDPNKGNEAFLSVRGDFANYQWYKNGVKIDLPQTSTTGLQIAKLSNAQGDGAYTVRVSGYDNCPSPPSEEKFIVFNDRAPINITAPSDPVLSNNSPSRINVSWHDNSDNETGFEIWSRRVDGSTTKWSLKRLSSADATSFLDTGLVPAASYEYILRAVSKKGRSQFTQVMTTETPKDVTPPSVPLQLSAEIVSADAIRLKWRPSTDDSGIKGYLIHVNSDTIETHSADTVFELHDFIVNAQYTFSIQAMDLGGNIGATSASIKMDTYVNGLFYQHSTGAWNSLTEIDWSIAEFTGRVEDFTLRLKTQDDFFNFRFDGYLNIAVGGVYQFRISSNDGSNLSIDDSLIIVNDGIHNLATVTAPIQVLSEGPHRITVDFFDSVLADTLLVEFKGPDSNNEWIQIPATKLRSDVITAAEEGGAGGGRTFDFELYPNPSTGEDLLMEFSNWSAGAIDVAVFGSTGKEIFTRHLDSVHDGPILLSETMDLGRGVYFVKVVQNGFVVIRKLLVIE